MWNKAEKTVTRPSNLLNNLMKAASAVSIIATDPQGLITAFSRGAEGLLGYAADQVIGRQVIHISGNMLVVADQGCVSQTGQGRVAEGFQVPDREGSEIRDCICRHRDGRHLPVQLNITPILSEQGETTGYLFIAHEITEREQSEDKFIKIFLTTPNCIAITKMADGLLVDFNKGFEEMTGWERNEAIGKTSLEISFWADPNQRHRMVEDLEAGLHIRNREFQFRRKDGSVRFGTYSASAIAIAGEPHLIFVLQDVTSRKETEKILQANEERLKGITTNMPGIVFQSYAADNGLWGISYASERLAELFELPLHPIDDLFARFLAHVHQEDLGRFRSSIQQAISSASPWNFEGRYVRPLSGGTLWFQGLSTPSRHSDRLVFDGLLLDITARKQAEQGIRQSEDRYRTIFEKSATANAIMAEDTTILLVNSNFEKLVGYSKEEIEGRMSWTLFVVEEYLQKMKQYHLQRRKAPGSAPETYEFKGKIRSGEVRDFYMSAAMIPGTLESVINLIDITERKRAEEALRESEDRYRAIFENSATANVITADDNTICLVNSNFERLLGYSKEEIEGKMKWTLFVQDECLEMMKQYDLQRRLDPDSVPPTYEFKGRNRSGEVLTLSVSVAVIPGAHVNIAQIIDITEQKRQEEYRRKLEQQLHHSQKLDAVGQLASGVAHDFNNILTGIQGNVSLMQMDYYGGHPHYQRLSQIEEQVKRGANLTRQLLGFARGGKYEVKAIDINDLIRKTTEFFLETKKEIQADLLLQDNLYSVEADAGQIEQVLLNLFINAGHAMSRGGALHIQTVNMTLGPKEAETYELPPGEYVKISVSDTGVGMSRETLSRIFEPFFTTKAEQGGTGLGLASCYGIMRNHGGAIKAYSELGKGTIFSLYLPSSRKRIEAEEKATNQNLPTGSGSILIVDDEPMILETASVLLETVGYTVYQASNGQEAVNTYRDNLGRIDLVILDMIMPRMSGAQTLRLLKEMHPQVKVILSSGYGLQGEVRKVLESGCLAFIQKPYILSDLANVVHQILHPALQPQV